MLPAGLHNQILVTGPLLRRAEGVFQPDALLTYHPRDCFTAWGTPRRHTVEATLPGVHTGPFHGAHWRRGAKAVNAGSGKPLQCCMEERAACQEGRHRLQLEGELIVANEPRLLAVHLYELRRRCISTERPLQPHVSCAGGGPHSWRDSGGALWNRRRGICAPRADLWRPCAYCRGAPDAMSQCLIIPWICSSWA